MESSKKNIGENGAAKKALWQQEEVVMKVTCVNEVTTIDRMNVGYEWMSRQ